MDKTLDHETGNKKNDKSYTATFKRRHEYCQIKDRSLFLVERSSCFVLASTLPEAKHVSSLFWILLE